jgi:uncharacterized protein (UPF0548 family)
LSTAARWPVGIGLTSWRYMWRTTAVHRWEMSGSMPLDAPPQLPEDVELEDVQRAEDGVGPLVHRLYLTRVVGSPLTPERLVQLITEDLDRIAPSEFATFQKLGGSGGLFIGDDYIVRMPGPWDGPVRVVAASPTSFRLATLDGHLEAGQIEFTADRDHRSLGFRIEAWARSGDRFSDVLYSHLRLAKEVQLHMWTSVLVRIAELAGGRMEGGVVVTTRRVAPGPAGKAGGSGSRRTDRKVASLASREVNFDTTTTDEHSPADGWRVDDMVETLPREKPGPPVENGSWQVARRLMVDYQLSDPRIVSASYDEHSPLSGRDMLLRIRFLGLRFAVGVRVGDVYEETRDLDGRSAQVFGWGYRTLEGHFEQGAIHYEAWKWLDTGDVEFRLRAFSKVAGTGPLLLRTGFRLVGRPHQLRFYRQACRRMRRLTESQLVAERAAERTS